MEHLLKRARECAHALEKHDEVLIVSHVDADGLASAGIMGRALDRIEKGYEIKSFQTNGVFENVNDVSWMKTQKILN